jgi:hypothetical protein
MLGPKMTIHATAMTNTRTMGINSSTNLGAQKP